MLVCIFIQDAKNIAKRKMIYKVRKKRYVDFIVGWNECVKESNTIVRHAYKH